MGEKNLTLGIKVSDRSVWGGDSESRDGAEDLRSKDIRRGEGKGKGEEGEGKREVRGREGRGKEKVRGGEGKLRKRRNKK